MTFDESVKYVSLFAPCAHESLDTSLGDGKTWAKCDDCGDTFIRANLDSHSAAAKKFEDAIDVIKSRSQSNAVLRSSDPVVRWLDDRISALESSEVRQCD